MCRAIVEAGLPGAMLAGLERTTPEQRAVIRSELTEHLA
jgi:hypothetical protein